MPHNYPQPNKKNTRFTETRKIVSFKDVIFVFYIVSQLHFLIYKNERKFKDRLDCFLCQ